MRSFSKPPRLKGFDYTAERTYFVTMCTWRRSQDFEIPVVAGIARDVVLRYRTLGRYFLYAYCIMPDHIHMLLKIRRGFGSLSTIVAVLKASIRNDAKPIANVIWTRGFHERIKREYERAEEYVKYITQNPVRAGLVTTPEDYAFRGSPDCWF